MPENILFEKYGQTIENGRVIFRENEEGKQMYIIQDGVVRIGKTIDGKEHVLAELQKGDFFGEMAIVTRVRRTATATAVGSVQLLSFDRAGFQGMIEKNSRIGLNIIDKLCRRLQHANHQIELLFQRNERSLIAMSLYIRFMEKGGDEPFLALDKTIQDLAKTMDMDEGAVMPQLTALAEAEVIAIHGNAIRLRDRTKLTGLAETLPTKR
ncbi:MAG TPA: Crp/Fnr family transcriptional regulator [Spirochaetia bacterium]|nr:Crp/Fnr family transcriptional regulator [Spirochaetia bacterium]